MSPDCRRSTRHTLTNRLDTEPEESDDLDIFLIISKIDVLETELTHAELDDSDECAEASYRTRLGVDDVDRDTPESNGAVRMCRGPVGLCRFLSWS